MLPFIANINPPVHTHEGLDSDRDEGKGAKSEKMS
jgi:hypothetical protein